MNAPLATSRTPHSSQNAGNPAPVLPQQQSIPGPLSTLSNAGVAVWLDDLSRQRLRTGNLAELIRTRGVVGVTTNPSIFQAAMSTGDAYDEQLRELACRKGPSEVSVGEAVRSLTTYDVRWAADVLEGVFERTEHLDGRVSLEVDPRLAANTEATIAEAKALAWAVDRPNLYIKIPATQQGLPAITEVLGAGISVNVTLIFSLQRYQQVIDAFVAGLELAQRNGHDLGAIASVASFFVSRVDSAIDTQLDQLGTAAAQAVRGKAGVANARLAYKIYQEHLRDPRWQALAAAGAHTQRPLWASTGVKDKQYSDTMYVDELIAPDTVNTMPEATLQAVADHGQTQQQDAVSAHYADAQQVLDQLGELGISYEQVVTDLEREGVDKFVAAWEQLLQTVAQNLDKFAPKP